MSLNPPFQRNFSIETSRNQVINTSLHSALTVPSASTSQNNDLIDIQIRNVVCNYVLPLHVDLRRVAMNTGNVTFEKNRGVLVKQKRNPPCYVKIYNTGKVYIVGCRSEAECKTASRQIARLIQRSMDKLHEIVRIRNYQVCNILATCKMPFGIKIEEIARNYPQTNYEPEISVGLIWKYKEPKATLRIHTTGSVTVTGATSESSISTVLQQVYPVLKQFGCAPKDLEASQYNLQNSANRKRFQQTNYNNHSTPAEFFISKRFKTTNVYNTNGPSSSSSGMIYFSDEEDLEEEYSDFLEEINY